MFNSKDQQFLSSLSTPENKRRSLLRSYTKGNKEEESQPATNDDDLMCVVCAGALGGPFPRPGSSPGYLLFKELYYTSLSLSYIKLITRILYKRKKPTTISRDDPKPFSFF